MAGANKRTTCALATTAVIFIIIIIILCLTPDPCYRNDPRPECKDSKFSASGYGSDRQSTTTTAPSTTPGSSTQSTESPTTSSALPSTTPGSSTQSTESPTTSSALPSTTTAASSSSRQMSSSETSSTGSTDEYLRGGTNSTASTTEVQDSSSSSVEASSTTPVSYTAYGDRDNETDSTNMTTEFESGGSTDTTYLYNMTLSTVTTSTTPEMDVTKNETSTDSTEALFENVTSTTSTTEDLKRSETSTWSTENGTATTTSATTTAVTTTASTTTAPNTTAPTTTASTTNASTTIAPTTSASTIVIAQRPSIESAGVCNTPICREVSRRMLDIMDPRDIDPCEDFYQYSCGGVLDDPFLKPEDPQVVADNIIKEAMATGNRSDPDLQELFVMYDSCLNYSSSNQSERLTEARKVFEELGYKFNPMAIKEYKDTHPSEPTDFDLGKALAEMMKRHFAPFFDIIIDVSKDNKSEFSLKMVLPSFGSAFTQDKGNAFCLDEYKKNATDAKRNETIFNVNEHYENYANCTKKGSGFRVRMDQIPMTIDELGLLDHVKDEAILNTLKSQSRTELDIMLGKLADVTPSIPEIRKALLNKEYEEVTVADIDSKKVFGPYLPISMESFIEVLLGYDIDPDQVKIQVYFKDIFTQYFNIIDENYDLDQPLMQNMMLLLWMEHIYDDLVHPLGATAGSIDYCIKGVTSYMDDYVTLLYLGELSEINATEKLENQMKSMIDLTITLMETQVENSQLQSRQDFVKKLKSMTGKVATLEHSREALQENKKIMRTMEEDNFAGNYISLMKNYRERLYRTYKDAANSEKSLWSVMQFAYRNTGVMSYGINTFLIPHGAMSPPYYYEEIPAYINYAGIGHMIAHELLHGFDSTGIGFDGSEKKAMRKDSSLTDGIRCLEQQLSEEFFFNSSTGFQYNFKLDVDLNVNELLADVAATSLAWDAYIKDLRTNGGSSMSMSTTSPRSLTAETISGDGTMSNITKFGDQILPHWEDTDILKMYFIKTAQNQCGATSELDILKVMENEHLPPKLRVNLGVKNNKLFRETFKCPGHSDTAVTPVITEGSGISDSTDDMCLFNPMGY